MGICNKRLYLVYEWKDIKIGFPHSTQKEMDEERKGASICDHWDKSFLIKDDSIKIEGKFISAKRKSDDTEVFFRSYGDIESFFVGEIFKEINEDSIELFRWWNSIQYRRDMGAITQEEFAKKEELHKKRNYELSFGYRFFNQMNLYCLTYPDGDLSSFFEGKELNRKEVPLRQAALDCYREESNNLCRVKRSDICTDYLKTHQIKDKPDYDAKILANYINKMKTELAELLKEEKLGNNRSD